MNPQDKSDGTALELRLISRQIWAVWRLIAPPYRRSLIVAALLLIVVSVCSTIFPILLGHILDACSDSELTKPQMYRVVGETLALIAGVILVRESLQVIRRYIVENACTRITKDLTVNMFSHLTKAELDTLTHDKLGTLQGRIGRCVVGFVRMIRLLFLDFLPPLFMGLSALIAVSKVPTLALTMACVVPVSLYLTLRQIRSQKGIRLQILHSQEEMDGAVVEQLAGLEYVRAANTHDYEVGRIADAAERRRSMENCHQFHMSLFGSAKALNESFFYILVLALAAHLYIEGQITYGEVFAYSALFVQVMAPLNEVHRALDEGHECSLLVAEFMKIVDEPLDRSFCLTQARDPAPVPGKPIIVMENLVVDYATECGAKTALRGISASIRHGETIGLVGPTGCGKSTCLRVLLRLTHPTSGRVTIAGVPLESVSRAAIGKLVGYVGQAPFVFSGTIAENIRYGSSDASPRAIQNAAARACIHDEIKAMPGGYQTLVTERGSNLSVGQRQRLALARVFLKDPPILILDEGTSALDTISERHIQSAIDLARKDRTVIMVAHRLTTLLDADRIYVFQDGRIAEVGTYAELYGQGGFFTHLVDCAETGTTGQHADIPAVVALGG